MIRFCFIFICFFLFNISVYGQTFDGNAPLVFPPPPFTSGVVASEASVSGIGLLNDCKRIDRVKINLNHTWTDDIAIFLIAPSGEVLDLAVRPGSPGGDNMIDTEFGDDAGSFLNSSTNPFTGFFKPDGREPDNLFPYNTSNPLGTFTFANTFNGVNADGDWSLYINDFVVGDVGILNSWSITFTDDPNFVLTVNAGADVNICSGEDVDLSVVPNNNTYTYNWSNGANDQTITVSPTVTTEYIVTVTTPSNCAGIDTVNVFVSPALDENDIAIDLVEPPLCTGQNSASLFFTFPTNDGYLIEYEIISPPQPNQNIVTTAYTGAPIALFNLGATTTVILKKVTLGNCSINLNLSNVINIPPPLEVDIDNIPNICPNETIDLNDFVSTTSGGTITYFTDPAYDPTSIIGSIVSPSVSTTYYGKLTLAPCELLFDVEVQVNNIVPVLPVPFNVNGCEIPNSSSGEFDLILYSNLINAANGGNAIVEWYEDMALTILINQNPYIGPPTTIYVKVSVNSCFGVFPIDLNIIAKPLPPTVAINIIEDFICFNGTINIEFTFPDDDIYTIEYQVTSPINTTTNIFQASNNINLVLNEIFLNSTVKITKITDNNSGCVFIYDDELIDSILVAPLLTGYSLFSTPPICQGVSVDLNDYVSSTTGLNFTFHTADPPTSANQIPSVVNPDVTTIYYIKVFGDFPDCYAVFGTQITVLIPVNISLLTATICENDNLNLNTLLPPNAPAGTWSGPGVTGNFFNGQGLAGNNEVTFTPTVICTGNPATTTITVNADVPFTIDLPDVCNNGSIVVLQTALNPVLPGNWSGPGVVSNQFDPSVLSPGNYNLIFNPDDACISNGTGIIEVLSQPEIEYLPGTSVCPGSNVNLLDYILNNNGHVISFHSDISANAGNAINNEIVNITSNQNVYIKAIDAFNCTKVFLFQIDISSGGAIGLGTANVCQNEGSFDLNSLFLTNPVNGIWSGSGVTANIFSPSNLDGTIPLIFIPDDACFTVSSTTIEVTVPLDLSFDPIQLCSNVGPVNLLTLGDPAYSNGLWSGTGVSNNVLNPLNLNGQYTLDFQSSAFCVNPAIMEVEVVLSQSPSLQDITVCENSNNIDLSLYVDPDFPIGNWSGNGVNGNLFLINGNIGLNQIQFISDEQCIEPATMDIDVKTILIPTLTSESICQDAGAFNLDNLNVQAIPGKWSGEGVNGAILNVDDLEGNIPLMFIPDELCSDTAATSVFIKEKPGIDFVTSICTGNEYVVSFNIVSTSNNVFVNGQGSTLNFVSQNIVSNTPYRFEITDDYLCGETVISGTINCACGNNAGSLVNEPILACANGKVTAQFNNNATLSAGDTLIFLLHNGSPVEIGTIYGKADKPEFVLPQSLSLTQTYYITAVTGNKINGDIDLSDPCLSIAFGVPVNIYTPSVEVKGYNDVCPGECFPIEVKFTGKPPFNLNLKYSNGQDEKNKSFQFAGLTNVVSICADSFVQSSNYKVFIETISDDNCFVVQNNKLDSFDIFSNRVKDLDITLCEGENKTVNGIIYDKNNPEGEQKLQTDLGCDSLINIKLNFLPNAAAYYNKNLCYGSSEIINGKLYNEINPKGIEIFYKQSANGCDSIVNVDLSFSNFVTYDFSPKLCKGETVNVNGTIYSEIKSSGQERIVNGSSSGCDSIINVKLSFFNEVINKIDYSICSNESIVINNKTYNKNKLSGIEILEGASINGCDSVIQVNLKLYPENISNLVRSICPSESIVINGNVYDQSKTKGQEVIKGGGLYGCDSIINIDIDILPYQVKTIKPFICENDTFSYLSKKYYKGKENGTDTLINIDNGCDTLVSIFVTFAEQKFAFDTLTLKSGEKLVIDGVTYDESRPNAVISGQAINGCDSTTYLNLKFQNKIWQENFQVENGDCEKPNGKVIFNRLSESKFHTIDFMGKKFNVEALPFEISDVIPGTYSFTITDEEGEQISRNAVIGFDNTKTDTITLDTLIVSANSSIDVFENTDGEFDWSPKENLSCYDCSRPLINLLSGDTTYEVKVKKENECTTVYLLPLKQRALQNELVFPNIIRKNTENGIWKIDISNGVKINQWSIFDRWGNKVFEANANTQSLAWDATINGQTLMTGVYVYYIVYELNGITHRKQGDITLIE